MNVQLLSFGKWSVMYGEPAKYQSPLRVDLCYPTVVSYKDALTNKPVGVVSKGASGQLVVSTVYNTAVVPVESKIEGFLLLSRLHKESFL